MIEEGQEVYVTSYALTRGIIKTITKEKCSDHSKPLLVYWDYDHDEWFRIGYDVFLTEEEAIQKAEKMREARIASLKKQMSKLENMDITAIRNIRKTNQ